MCDYSSEHRNLYLKTIEVNLTLYLESLKYYAAKHNCQEQVNIVFDNVIIENNTITLLSHFIMDEIEKYGDIFNTATLEFDDIKVIFFIAAFLENHFPDSHCKDYLLLNALYLTKNIIQEEKAYKDYSDDLPVKIKAFTMIDKLIERIESKKSGFLPLTISHDDLIDYYGIYGIYVLAKTSYYPFQSYIDEEYESYKILIVALELLKEEIPLDPDELIKHLDILSKNTNNQAKVEALEESLYQSQDEALRKKLKERQK